MVSKRWASRGCPPTTRMWDSASASLRERNNGRASGGPASERDGRKWHILGIACTLQLSRQVVGDTCDPRLEAPLGCLGRRDLHPRPGDDDHRLRRRGRRARGRGRGLTFRGRAYPGARHSSGRAELTWRVRSGRTSPMGQRKAQDVSVSPFRKRGSTSFPSTSPRGRLRSARPAAYAASSRERSSISRLPARRRSTPS